MDGSDHKHEEPGEALHGLSEVLTDGNEPSSHYLSNGVQSQPLVSS